jgi:hypothetical protein
MLAMEQREIPLRQGLLSRVAGKVSDSDLRELERCLGHYHPRAIIFADEGKEHAITKAFRKMSVHNPIPSNLGTWPDGRATKSIPVQRVIEDPVFRKSHQSYLIQLADCVAYALLKREVPPTPKIRAYGVHEMFERNLAGVCFKKASSDPLGIVRK